MAGSCVWGVDREAIEQWGNTMCVFVCGFVWRLSWAIFLGEYFLSILHAVNLLEGMPPCPLRNSLLFLVLIDARKNFCPWKNNRVLKIFRPSPTNTGANAEPTTPNASFTIYDPPEYIQINWILRGGGGGMNAYYYLHGNGNTKTKLSNVNLAGYNTNTTIKGVKDTGNQVYRQPQPQLGWGNDGARTEQVAIVSYVEDLTITIADKEAIAITTIHTRITIHTHTMEIKATATAGQVSKGTEGDMEATATNTAEVKETLTTSTIKGI
jgi:hypothetical protein